MAITSPWPGSNVCCGKPILRYFSGRGWRGSKQPKTQKILSQELALAYMLGGYYPGNSISRPTLSFDWSPSMLQMGEDSSGITTKHQGSGHGLSHFHKLSGHYLSYWALGNGKLQLPKGRGHVPSSRNHSEPWEQWALNRELAHWYQDGWWVLPTLTDQCYGLI